ncbi:MAG: chemotaxis protein CheR [Magnetococcales bacterium]|nr:chemotaxis protein CheR [Magnetococcales bacterium]
MDRSSKAPPGSDSGSPEYRLLRDILLEQEGMDFPPNRETYLLGRATRRARTLGITSLKAYIELLQHEETGPGELPILLDFLLAHRTEFFHDPAQFEFLMKSALPDLIKNAGVGVKRPLMAWSAGCSTGEESYTLAMVFCEFAERFPGFNFRSQILATDISNSLLDKARTAIYGLDRVRPIPLALKKKYLLRSKSAASQQVRIVPELRNMAKFRLLDLRQEGLFLREKMDLIFCRNVLCQFDTPTREAALTAMCNLMEPGAFLFTGTGENLQISQAPLYPVAPDVFCLAS